MEILASLGENWAAQPKGNCRPSLKKTTMFRVFKKKQQASPVLEPPQYPQARSPLEAPQAPAPLTQPVAELAEQAQLPAPSAAILVTRRPSTRTRLLNKAKRLLGRPNLAADQLRQGQAPAPPVVDPTSQSKRMVLKRTAKVPVVMSKSVLVKVVLRLNRMLGLPVPEIPAQAQAVPATVI